MVGFAICSVYKFTSSELCLVYVNIFLIIYLSVGILYCYDVSCTCYILCICIHCIHYDILHRSYLFGS